jgi:hypothetical protein
MASASWNRFKPASFLDSNILFRPFPVLSDSKHEVRPEFSSHRLVCAAEVRPPWLHDHIIPLIHVQAHLTRFTCFT